MHYGLLSLDLHGHLNPLTTLGGELARRGHRVTLLGSSRGRPFAERAGLGWHPINDTPEAMEGWDQLGELAGLAALKFTGSLVRQHALATKAELPPAIASLGIDSLVIDQLAPAGVVVAEQLGLPYVVACNALAVHVHHAVPPCALNWKHAPGMLWTWRNRLGNWLARSLFDRFAGALESGGISPLMLADLQPERGAAVIAQQPACFDFPGHPRPSHFHYTAPWHAAGRDSTVAFPWEWLDGRPLVFASMGTLQNKLRHVFAAIAEAARGLDLQLVLSLGSPTATLEIDAPENVLVVPFAPQLQLLERTAAVVTHAGLNTALETLAQGLPMVCLPVTNDQPGIARRVEFLGAGVVVGRVTASAVRRGLTRVLTDPLYRAAAHGLREKFQQLNGPLLAADIIERVTR